MRKLYVLILLAVATIGASGCANSGRPGLFNRNHNECCYDPCGGPVMMAPPTTCCQ